MAHDAPASPAQTQSSSSSSGFSFIQGFLLGQLSIAILIIAFIKLFIFGDVPSSDSRATIHASQRRSRTLAHARRTSLSLRRSRSGVLRQAPTPQMNAATILAKTYYNVHGHQPESVDWFNVLVAQTIAQLRADAQQDDAILASLNNVLNGDKRPGFVDEINVTEISLGEEFPIFSNCRVIPVEDALGAEGGRLQARMDVDLSDFITLGVETKLKLNWPRPHVAVLPVALAVSVVRFSGTLSLSFVPSPSTATATATEDPSAAAHSSNPTPSPAPTTLNFSFLDDYRLDLSVRSLIGSRSRLQDIPKIAELVESRLHAWFDERCVEPRFQQIVLPSFWPRKRNTRGGNDEEAVGTGSESEEGAAKPAARTTNGSATGFAPEEVAARLRHGAPDRGVAERDGLEWRKTARSKKPRSSGERSFQMPGAMPGMMAS